MDAVKNFSLVGVSTGYDASATTIVLTTGDGAKLPAPATDGLFNLVWFNSTDYTNPADDPNKEIIRVSARSTDTLTVLRAQEGTSASTHNTGGKAYKMILTVTAKTITDLKAYSEAMHPIGCVFIGVVNTSPATLLGFGTWSQIAGGKCLVGQTGADTDFDTVEETGGAKTVSLAHSHTINDHSHLGADHLHYVGGSTSQAVDADLKRRGSTEPQECARGVHTHTFAVMSGAADRSLQTGGASDRGTNSQLSATQSIVQPYLVVYIWKRTA